MPKRQYKEISFQSKSRDLIELVNAVIEEYSAQGYELTLRQVYYQLVARGYTLTKHPPTVRRVSGSDPTGARVYPWGMGAAGRGGGECRKHTLKIKRVFI